MDVATGGARMAAVPIAAGAVAVLVSPAIGILLLGIGVLVLAFHRDPDRSVPLEGIVAPADGIVQVVRREGNRVRVGVFMNVHDVHVNRAPIDGTVEDVTHVPGAFRPAFTKESDRNERVHVDLSTEIGSARVTMIAGAFARRIHPYVDPGDELERGERIGHISFGSRVDVVLPPPVGPEDLAVDRGDRVRAGESVLIPGDAVGPVQVDSFEE